MIAISTLMTALVPDAAAFCGHCAPMAGGMPGMSGMHGCGGGHAASVMMAAVAALGYWVLSHSSKDSGAVRRGGQVVGWVLLVVGLLGFLCGAAAHARLMGAPLAQCPMPPASAESPEGMMPMPSGRPPVDAAAKPVGKPALRKKGR